MWQKLQADGTNTRSEDHSDVQGKIGFTLLSLKSVPEVEDTFKAWFKSLNGKCSWRCGSLHGQVVVDQLSILPGCLSVFH